MKSKKILNEVKYKDSKLTKVQDMIREGCIEAGEEYRIIVKNPWFY